MRCANSLFRQQVTALFTRGLAGTVAAVLLVSSPVPAQGGPGVPSRSGLVVATDGIAADVGAAILRAGGNAVDAAVATAFALAVTHPSAGNIGGGGFMVIHQPGTEPVAIDYRERAPLRSTETMYLAEDGSINRSLTAAGYLAAGVPGTVRGMELAHRRFGRLAWSDVVMPAVRLAEGGFVLTPSLARSLNGALAGAMGRFPSSVAAYGKPGGGTWAAGDRIVLGDLGKALRAIATDGADAFYTGWIADRIVEAMEANGGIISHEDLRLYRAVERVPVRGTYKGFDIISMPPPSSGGTALITMLNIVEPLDLKSRGRSSVETLHWLIEARRLAFLDRARYLGDPDFVDVPFELLSSKAHARELAALIDPERAGNSAALGKDVVTVDVGESEETTHFSVIDADGMAVSNTYTIEAGYGAKAVVAGAGFLLNNEMGDFNKKPGTTNLTGDIGTPANIIAPGKRMLSSMTPTIVTRDGKVVLVTGSPGGRTIINTVFDIVLNVLEFGMRGQDAVDAPRMDHQWIPDRARLETGGADSTVLARLREMGHRVEAGGTQGDGQTIYVDPATGIAYGARDRRSADSKAAVAVPPVER